MKWDERAFFQSLLLMAVIVTIVAAMTMLARHWDETKLAGPTDSEKENAWQFEGVTEDDLLKGFAD